MFKVELCDIAKAIDPAAYDRYRDYQDARERQEFAFSAAERVFNLYNQAVLSISGSATSQGAAEPSEPSFTLLGRDPQAPALIERWAADREVYEPDSSKSQSARRVAAQMRMFKIANPDKGMNMSAVISTLGPITQGDIAARIREVADLYRGANGQIAALGPMSQVLADLFLDIHEEMTEQNRLLLTQTIKEA